MTHARRILEEVDQIADLARHRHGALTSVLRLGIIPTLSPYILPLILNQLHQSFPAASAGPARGPHRQPAAALEDHALDVLLVALPEHAAVHRSMALFEEPFYFVCPTGHKLGNRPAVTENDLVEERLLLLEEGHCLREQALAVCGEQFRDWEAASDDFRATSLETICEMVAAGLGSTLLPAMALPHLPRDDQRLAVRPINAAKASRVIGLLWRASFPRSEDLLVLGRFIQEQLPDTVEPIDATPATRAQRRDGSSSPARSEAG